MGGFFHGWRRKVGCVTLVMACAVAGMWLRSYRVVEQMFFPFDSRQHGLWIFEGRIYWLAWTRPSGEVLVSSYDAEYEPAVSLIDVESNLQSCVNSRTFPEFVFWTIYPGIFLIPLILLSAYLILWRPRKCARD